MDTRHKGGWLLGCVWGQWRDMVSSVVVLRFLHMSTIAPPLLAYLPWLLGTPCTVISTSMSTTLGYFTVFPFVALPGRELSGVLQCAQL